MMYWRDIPAVPSTLPLAPGVLASLRPEDRILDCGCGAGRVLAELAGQGLGRFHCGLDINAPSLALAKAKGFSVIQGDLTARPLPLADGAVDVSFLQAVLPCLVPEATRRAVLAEIRRVTRRVLCVADFLLNPDLPLYRARYEAGLAETGEQGSFVVREGDRVLYTAHHFSEEELTALLADVGFAVEHLETPLVRTRSGNTVRGVLLSARAVC
jgi:SAM-dependent methyltransferase